MDIGLFMPRIVVPIGRSGGKLQGAEHAGVDIAFHFKYPTDESGVTGQHSYTPSGHIVAFAHGVEFYAAILSPRYLQNTDMFLSENETVGIVVDNDYSVATGKLHEPFVGWAACRRTSGHIGIVHPHQPHAGEIHSLKLFKIRLPVIFRP